jgi:hypothetical protein
VLGWVERFDILLPSQFGFKKGNRAHECLFLLKKKTLVAFLDILGAYNNVLIDVLCKNLCGFQASSGDGPDIVESSS